MKWNNLKPDISAIPLEVMIQHWSVFDVLKLLNATRTTPLVVMVDSVRSKIMEHLSSRKVELGGLLVGNVISSTDLEDGIVAINITNAIASCDFDSTSVSLSMSADVWQLANKLNDNTSFVVGWYHSHPNLGAYFSGTDRKTQKDFFNNEYSLGLVIDPIRKEECWFKGANSSEVSLKHVIRSTNGVAVV